MKNKYTIAYISAIIAVPVALLFIVPAVATTSANVFGGDMQTLFTDAQNQALSSFGNTDSNVLPVPGTLLSSGESTDNVLPVPGMIYTLSSNEVSGTGVSAGASSGSTGSAGSATTGTGGSAWASNSGYANANVSVDLGCTDCNNTCENVPVPSCTFDALPSTIHAGESVTLTWDTTNATAVSIDGIGAVSIDGSKIVTPTASRSYTLNATSNGGAAKCVKTVQVVPVTVPVPSCTFDALPSTIHAGESVTLTWDTTNATAVSIDGIGAVSIDGSKIVTPTASRSYTLNATSNGGAAKCVKTVQVVPVTVPVPSCTFDALPSTIHAGESVTLTWDTTNATAVSIDGIGAVSIDGSKIVTPTASRSYTLNATSNGVSATCTTFVGVTAQESGNTTSTTTFTNVNNNYNYNYNSYSGGHSSSRNNDNVSCDSFTVSDAHVEKGDTVTLKWKTTDADDVDINQGVGDVSDDGSEEVKITKDTTFTLTARNNGSTDTCRVKVDVESDKTDNDNLRCVFSVSDTSIYSGQSAILTWVNYATDRLVLKDGNGKTLADSKKDKDIDEDVDALTVTPSKTTKYTLDVYKGNKKETCTLTVDVEKGTVQGISLSQTPYTGFDAGPMLTAFFYGAIVLWGLVLAYILVLKKKSAQILKK